MSGEPGHGTRSDAGEISPAAEQAPNRAESQDKVLQRLGRLEAWVEVAMQAVAGWAWNLCSSSLTRCGARTATDRPLVPSRASSRNRGDRRRKDEARRRAAIVHVH